MLEVKGIPNGIVIDHIKAGNGLKIFNKLFSATENPVVLLMNVASKAQGKKDIIKIENTVEVNLDILGIIDPNITVNYIKEGKLIDKKHVSVPKILKGGIECHNPRCITHTDDYAIAEFKLISQNGKLEYECSYCEEITAYKL